MKFSIKVPWSLNDVNLYILWASKYYKNPPSERNGRKKVRQRVFSPSFIYYSENLKALGKSDNIKYHVTYFVSNLCVRFQPTLISFKLFKSFKPQSALKAFLSLLQTISFNMAFWSSRVGYSDWKSVKPNQYKWRITGWVMMYHIVFQKLQQNVLYGAAHRYCHKV